MSETVRSDSYLTLHYRITALDGEEFLSTFDMSPATLQMGSGQTGRKPRKRADRPAGAGTFRL